MSLYYFRQHDIKTDKWPQSRRPATMDTIHRLGGTPVIETEFEVDLDQIDEDGFLKVDQPLAPSAKKRFRPTVAPTARESLRRTLSMAL